MKPEYFQAFFDRLPASVEYVLLKNPVHLKIHQTIMNLSCRNNLQSLGYHLGLTVAKKG